MKLVYIGYWSDEEIINCGPNHCDINNCEEELNAFDSFKLIIIPRKISISFNTCSNCAKKLKKVIKGGSA